MQRVPRSDASICRAQRRASPPVPIGTTWRGARCTSRRSHRTVQAPTVSNSEDARALAVGVERDAQTIDVGARRGMVTVEVVLDVDLAVAPGTRRPTAMNGSSWAGIRRTNWELARPRWATPSVRSQVMPSVQRATVQPTGATPSKVGPLTSADQLGSGWGRVRLRLRNGARCMVGFLSHDASKPTISGPPTVISSSTACISCHR